MCTPALKAHQLANRFGKTFTLLQEYDEGFKRSLSQVQTLQEGSWPLTEAREELQVLRNVLMSKGEATELFAKERGDAFTALWGNLEATVFGSEAYPTVESRAAHLLYFVVKNHPFSDGNKRSGAYLFISYLERQGCLYDAIGNSVVKDNGLAALIVLIAESKPEQKDLLIDFIINTLERGTCSE